MLAAVKLQIDIFEEIKFLKANHNFCKIECQLNDQKVHEEQIKSSSNQLCFRFQCSMFDFDFMERFNV